MEENFQSDILIEGEGITAVALAYFLSKSNKEDTINLVLKQQDKTVSPHFNPGIAIPVFKLPLPLMETIFSNSTRIFKDLNSITSYFEFTQNPLLMLYREKKSIEILSQHKEKLQNSKLKFSELSLEDIESYYPFFNTEKELRILEIYDSYTCSNPYEIFIAFQKLAEENEVYIIRESEELELNDVRSFKTDKTSYEANKLAITTSNYNLNTQRFQKKEVLKLVTPIFERFPKISLVDLSNSSFMWLEEAGYFHIFRTINEGNDTETIQQLKDDFSEVFTLSDSLEVLDSSNEAIEVTKSIKDSVGYIAEKDIFHVNIPIHLELSVSATIAERFAQFDQKKINEKKENFTIQSIFEK